MKIRNLISTDLCVPQTLVDDALRQAHFRYRKIRVKKRSGGERIIAQPTPELRLILEWINARVLSKLPISDIATGFRPGSSILKNAKAHRNSRYSVRVDIRNFFPSITPLDLITCIKASKDTLPEYCQLQEFDALLRQACFDKNGRLPVGYSTSPQISNCVMYSLDNSLSRAIHDDAPRFGNGVITRYADDFIFSSEKQGACNEFINEFRAQIKACQSPRLTINDDKTRFMSRGGGSTLITGLRINNDGNVRVHPNYRDHVRLLLKHYASGKLDVKEFESLRGHLAFVEHSDPLLFTRLSFKYHAEIAKVRGQQ